MKNRPHMWTLRRGNDQLQFLNLPLHNHCLATLNKSICRDCTFRILQCGNKLSSHTMESVVLTTKAILLLKRNAGMQLKLYGISQSFLATICKTVVHILTDCLPSAWLTPLLNISYSHTRILLLIAYTQCTVPNKTLLWSRDSFKSGIITKFVM